MKTGMDLQSFSDKVKDQKERSRDFLVDTREAHFQHLMGNFELVLEGDSNEIFTVNENTHSQIGERLGIPRKYYKRLKDDHQELLEKNVNTLFNEEPERMLVRTMDDTARAFLSSQYRRIDNYDIASAVLPRLQEIGDLEIKSCQVSMEHMWIKAVFPEVSGDVEPGDVVQAGINIQNSEVGCGSLRFEPLIYRLACSNGMICKDKGIKQVHLGKKSTLTGSNFIELSEETKRKSDRLLMSKLDDLLNCLVSGDMFYKILNDMRRAKGREIQQNVDQFIEELGDVTGLTDDEESGVLEHLASGGELSQYGAGNAITRHSQDVDSYKRSTELEKMGAEVMSWNDREWNKVAV